MAIIESSLFDSIRGKLGKQYVFKKYNNKIVIAVRPKKYKRTLSPIKELYEQRFKNAVQFARNIMHDKELSEPYRKRMKPTQRLYSFLISEYYRLELYKEPEITGQQMPPGLPCQSNHDRIVNW